LAFNVWGEPHPPLTCVLAKSHIAPGGISGSSAPDHFSTAPWTNVPFHFPSVVPAGASLFTMSLLLFQHFKLLIIFESCVSSLNNCLQSSFSKSVI
jgi:hypothetical protein